MMKAIPRPRVYIFDLDNTLFDTRTIPRSITDPLFAALRSENVGDDAVAVNVLEQAFEDSWSVPFPQVAAKHGLPDRLLKRWADLHQSLMFTTSLQPFDDVVEVLSSITTYKILLTSGYPKVQHGKIDALGLRPWFDEILIDAADDPFRKGKQAIIQDLMAERTWPTTDLLIIGDSPTSEIAAGKNLGIPTVQILRPGVIPSELADFQIQTLREL